MLETIWKSSTHTGFLHLQQDSVGTQNLVGSSIGKDLPLVLWNDYQSAAQMSC